ncbi:Putative E3 ubiquitin-protein ligase TRIML2 [Myotis brandtii]|uniref:Putative E3 ubiquitin-protein ligase TRIML2 n=1 Tax=Myotis brandtii TaxID=109478 RepID=S7Q7G8_MYOBR|nr:PREDICTED: probable E3 ubiquitin-protein ligase TRIML2 [Myotis brandtii]EPQ19328.1 Putative E3 ubiquitin-protein ligase TRIML2 [Myotis brandtii]
MSQRARVSKRRRLQPPRGVPGEASCRAHLEPLLLFCEDDQVTLCRKCFLAQEHGSHVVRGVHEAAEKYRKLFRELLSTLKQKLEAAKSLLAEEQENMGMVQAEEQNFKEMLKSEYKMMIRLVTEENVMNFQNLQGYPFNPHLREASLSPQMKFTAELEEKYQETLQRLNSLGRENMSKLHESEVRLYEQIISLHSVTAELEKKCGEPSLVLLKDAGSLELSGVSLLCQGLEPARITDPSLCQRPGLSEVLELFQRPITLDPKTANPCLVLSEDLRSVRLRNVQQDVPGNPEIAPGNPEIFDFGASVLGVESFTSGRHYWEVDVEKTTNWQLGIYEDSAARLMPKASEGKILLMGSRMGTKYTLWVFPPLKGMYLEEQMHKVGVFLDYKYGQISFYDVTKRFLIYNFSDLVFKGALRPIFSLCFPNEGTNSDSLSICLPDVFVV